MTKWVRYARLVITTSAATSAGLCFAFEFYDSGFVFLILTGFNAMLRGQEKQYDKLKETLIKQDAVLVRQNQTIIGLKLQLIEDERLEEIVDIVARLKNKPTEGDEWKQP